MEPTPAEHPTALADGRYKIIRPLGQGGMASVYRAWDTRLAVYRAIKVLDPAFAHRASLRTRFVNEARTMARLHHPNIVTVHDVSDDGGAPYIVMEIMHGGSLADRVTEHGKLPPRTAARVTRDLLRALQVAHSAGVIHRDVKPQNVLISAEGVPKLTDFGIAHIETEQNLTRTGAVMGTLSYMPPEQRRGERNLTPATDVYAAGATLYALASGNDPFDMYSPEMEAELFAGFPPALADIIKRATKYRAEDRWPSADAMARALELLEPELPDDPPGTPPLATAHARETEAPPPNDAPAPPAHKPGAMTPTFVASQVVGDDFAPGPRAPGPGGVGTPNLGDSAQHGPVAGTLTPRDTSIITEPEPARSAPKSSMRWVAGLASVVALAMAGIWLAGQNPPDPQTDGVASASAAGQPAENTAPPSALSSSAGTDPSSTNPRGSNATGTDPSGANPSANGPSATDASGTALSTPEPGQAATAEVPPTLSGTADRTPAGAGLAAINAGSTSPISVPTSTSVSRTAVTPPASQLPAPNSTARPTSATTASRPSDAKKPASPEPAPVADLAPGTLFVNSRPYSQVTLDGAQKGSTGWKGEVAAGKHSVKLDTADGRTITRQVVVPAGKVEKLCWDFDAESECER